MQAERAETKIPELSPGLVAEACHHSLVAYERELDYAFQCWRAAMAGKRKWVFGPRYSAAELEALWRHPDTPDGLLDRLRRQALTVWQLRRLLGLAEAGLATGKPLRLTAADHASIAANLPDAARAAQQAVLNLAGNMLSAVRHHAADQGLYLREHPGVHSTYVVAKGHPEAVQAFLAACQRIGDAFIVCGVREAA